MTIEKSANYFEQDAGWISSSSQIKHCKDCSCRPTVLSLREKETIETEKIKGYVTVRLLGMKIICSKCKKFITRYHNHHHVTLHPDDSTIKIVIEEWNEKN